MTSMTQIGPIHLIKFPPQYTLLEPSIPLCPNPIPAFLPPGLQSDNSLVLASRLAQLYSDLQGQALAMTNTPVAELDMRCEST